MDLKKKRVIRTIAQPEFKAYLMEQLWQCSGTWTWKAVSADSKAHAACSTSMRIHAKVFFFCIFIFYDSRN